MITSIQARGVHQLKRFIFVLPGALKLTVGARLEVDGLA